MLYGRAWESGLFQSDRTAFVGDGSTRIWTIWSNYFKAWESVPILDAIHAVTHVYAAAMVCRTQSEGWPIYEQWITWIWNSEVDRVIAAVRARAAELGEPTNDDGPTSVRHIAARSSRSNLGGAPGAIRRWPACENLRSWSGSGAATGGDSTNCAKNERIRKGTIRFSASKDLCFSAAARLARGRFAPRVCERRCSPQCDNLLHNCAH